MKKQSSAWFIALLHYLIAGLVLPFLVSFVLAIPLIIIIGKDKTTELTIFLAIIIIFSLFPSIIWSSRYITNRYEITDSNKICNLATLYLIIFEVGRKLFNLYITGLNVILLIGFCTFIIMAIVFYLLSKKYIHNTEVSTEQVSVAQ